MCMKRGLKTDSTSREEKDTGIRSHSEEDSTEKDKEFVLRCLNRLVESSLAILHRHSDEDQHLYLITGETFRLAESGLTRLY